MSDTRDRFCGLCDVALELHDGTDSCRSAEMKANIIGLFWLGADA